VLGVIITNRKEALFTALGIIIINICIDYITHDRILMILTTSSALVSLLGIFVSRLDLLILFKDFLGIFGKV